MLVGEWEATLKGEPGRFIFKDNSEADVIIGGKPLNDDENIAIQYLLDPSTKPMSLDIVFACKCNPHEYRLLTILEFLDDDKIKIRFDFQTGKRPEKFAGVDESNEVIFTKVTTN